MKKTFTRLLTVAALMQAGTALAQDEHCGTNNRLKELYAKNSQLRVDHENFLRDCFASSAVRSDSNTVYVIPVVFHIMHEYGSENISDAQVRDVVRAMNEDFRKLNADTITIVPAFQGLVADAHIEFRLASLDPNGDCTNGINHYFSHETRIGDDFSKLVQWPRSKYLNFWVTNNMEEGTAAYAYHPTDVAALPMATVDGIIVRDTYVGSIGTSNPGRVHTLSHEVGHYLSLPHTWGNTNDPGLTCGDDGLADTPVTKGHTACNATTLNDQTCTPGVIENTQNYMEYSGCQLMFTFDQKFAMRSALESSIANRNNLWSASNHTATGVDVIPAPVCTPVPDMFPNEKHICYGDNVTFTDVSWRADVDSWSWSFPGGTPATSTAANPVITYNTAGWHDVTLTVTNTAGTETKTFVQAVYVSNPWSDYVGPHTESFEAAAPSAIWVVENPESNEAAWHRITSLGATGTSCFMLNNHKDIDIFSMNYYNQLGGNKDALISPSFDLSNTSSATLTFKFACASHATTMANQTEQLQVYSSTNCGKTWQPRGGAIDGAELATGGTVSGNFIPTGSTWATKSITLPASIMQENVRFKFEYTSSDYSNNIYLDDININGLMGQVEVNAPEFELEVFPNPSTADQGITVSFNGNNGPLQLVVNDVVGKTVYTTNIAAQTGKTKHQVAGHVLSSGMYMATITNGTYARSVKFVVH